MSLFSPIYGAFYEMDLLCLFSSLTRQVRKIKKWHLHPKYNMKDSTRDQTCKRLMIFYSRSKISLLYQGVMWLWQFWSLASSIRSRTVFLLRKKLQTKTFIKRKEQVSQLPCQKQAFPYETHTEDFNKRLLNKVPLRFVGMGSTKCPKDQSWEFETSKAEGV